MRPQGLELWFGTGVNGRSVWCVREKEVVVGKCRGKCGCNLGFLMSGLCNDCQSEMERCEKGIAILRRLNPPWRYSPESTYEDGEGNLCWNYQIAFFNCTTPDGDTAFGQIGYWLEHSVELKITVNNVLLLDIRARDWSCGWVEKLEPYFQSIVQDWWKRKDVVAAREKAEKEAELKAQSEKALKQKYGL